MAEHRNSHLIRTLRAALKQVEESEEFSPKDHTFLRLKRSIMLAIADLEDKAKRNAPAA